MAIKNSLAINSLEFCEKLTQELDKVATQSSVTGFLEDSAFRSKFVGAKTILIPEVGMSALADYDRDTGYTRGSITVTNTPFTLQMDRGRFFMIDQEDSEETGLANLIGSVLSEFVRTQVAPEMDAYVLSKLAGVANDNEQTVAPGTDAISTLQELMLNVQEETGYGNEEMVAFVDRTFYAALMNSPSVSRQLVLSDFSKGGLNTRVKSLDGCALLPVTSTRMKTAYDFLDGTTSGQEDGGFKPTSTAKSIRCLVMPKHGSAHLVKKAERTKIYTPEQVIDFDGYRLNARYYYDLFVKNSKKGTIWACVE